MGNTITNDKSRVCLIPAEPHTFGNEATKEFNISIKVETLRESSPLVSVILPVFNGGALLKVCMDSILEQNYTNLEITIIDDGSTDSTGVICDSYAKIDKRVKVVHTENKGPSSARNIGIYRAKGEFVYFVDADDRLGKSAISDLLLFPQLASLDMVISSFSKVKNKEHNETVYPTVCMDEIQIICSVRKYLREPSQYELFSYSWGRIYRMRLILKYQLSFNVNLFSYEDVDFNFQYLKHTRAIASCDNVSYFHHINLSQPSARLNFGKDPNRLMGHLGALQTVDTYLKSKVTPAGEFETARHEMMHAVTYLSIIQYVRICASITRSNVINVYQVISLTITNPLLQTSLPFYKPQGNDSRMIPLFIKHKQVILLMMLCRYKSIKRYVLNKSCS